MGARVNPFTGDLSPAVTSAEVQDAGAAMASVVFDKSGTLYSPIVGKVRVVPSTANLFYVVMKSVEGAKVARFQRGIYVSTSADLGGEGPEFRLTGYGVMSSYDLPPSVFTRWVADEAGAFDMVGRNAANVRFGSYHGLGPSGTLNSESIMVDGIEVSHTLAREGSVFELRNVTTATNGTDVLSRDLSVSTDAGKLKLTVNAITATGMSLVYFGMPIASGSHFNEIHVRTGLGFTGIPLGVGEADCEFLAAKGMTMRSPSTGLYMAAYGELPSITGFANAWSVKQIQALSFTDRQKSYWYFTSNYGNLVGASINYEWGEGLVGEAAYSVNKLTNTVFSAPEWTYQQGGGNVSVNNGILTMTRTTGAPSNLRAYASIPGVAVGQKYLMAVDFLGRSNSAGTIEAYAGSNTNGSSTSPLPALTIGNSVFDLPKRVVRLFTATQGSPNQAFLVRNASTENLVTQWANPAVYAVAP
ncbi:hypothetical protein Astex_0349 [Asticcacaulis excentricus CB 48]|uniref:Uncharacterized protein n=2 Tax=Asticcacaulis excentricus TaxID=78587 RepID=E8RPR9_ASTEC|nr:hypothetical protein Astex_0349 [Asticcacaulis excentricus CB 48]